MTRNEYDAFVRAVSDSGVCADDLRRRGAWEYFNDLIDRMDAAYGKDSKTFYAMRDAIMGLLKQVMKK